MKIEKLTQIKKLYNEGYSFRKIAKEVGCSRTTVAYWLTKDEEYIKTKVDFITDARLAEAIRQSTSVSETLRKLGKPISSATYNWFYKRNKELEIDTNHFKGKAHGSSRQNKKIPYEKLLIENSEYRITNDRKKALIRDGYLDNKCQICNMSPRWNGKELTLRLDHINGNGYDHRIENLRLICPNCDSQLPTFCGRNIKYRRPTG